MYVTMYSFLRTLNILGMLASLPKSSALKRVAKDMFAEHDTDHDGFLSPDEFFAWALGSVAGAPLVLCVPGAPPHAQRGTQPGTS